MLRVKHVPKTVATTPGMREPLLRVKQPTDVGSQIPSRCGIWDLSGEQRNLSQKVQVQ